MRRLADERGFMLTELLVGMVVAIAVFGATLSALEMITRASGRHDRQAQAQDAARSGIDRLVVQIRNAQGVLNSSGDPTEAHSAYDIVFLAPALGADTTNNAQGLMHVRYCLEAATPSNETLWMQTAPYNSTTLGLPPSTASCPGTTSGTAGDWRVKQAVATNLVNKNQSPNKPLFTYSPSVGSASEIALDAWVDADTTGGAPPSELQTTVALRNLNHAPVVPAPTCVAQNGHAVCDASSAYDVDGQALSYVWTVPAACAAPATSSHMDITCPSGTSGTFTVTVSDSGGASTPASTTLTMP